MAKAPAQSIAKLQVTATVKTAVKPKAKAVAKPVAKAATTALKPKAVKATTEAVLTMSRKKLSRMGAARVIARQVLGAQFHREHRIAG